MCDMRLSSSRRCCRARYPQHWEPWALMAASALPHAPFSIALHSMIGVSERTRDVLRTLDVFFILTCGGEDRVPLVRVANLTPGHTYHHAHAGCQLQCVLHETPGPDSLGVTPICNCQIR